MTIETIIILIFATLMTILALIDEWTFLRGKHIEYKSVIVSVGVLGTFLGIFLGLLEFNTTDIAASVPPLLEGLKFAFLTSIIGMGLSVLLSVLQPTAAHKTKKNEDNLEKINQSLAAILEHMKQLRAEIYHRHYRFTKLNCHGQAIADEAKEWVAIIDNQTGLTWEIKTNDGELQDAKHTYTWYQQEGDIVGIKNSGKCKACRCDTEAYIESVNQKQLASYNNWRMPTIEELESLVSNKTGIDKRYFPHIQSGWYCSATPYVSEKQIFCLFSFETGHRGYNKYGYGYVLLTREGN